jgi:hypothetical protein
MARQESERGAVELGKEDVVGGFSPWTHDAPPASVRKSRKIVEAGTADNAQNRLHAPARQVSSNAFNESVDP